jgi:hypothetical protein
MKIIANKCSYCKFPIDTKDLKLNKTYHQSCRQLADEFTSTIPSVLADIIRRTRKRCEKDGTEWKLGTDIEAMRTLLDLYESQNGVDPLTSLEMSVDVEGEFRFLMKPSLDRIDNSRGYEVGNLRLVTIWSNLQRNLLSDEQFYYLSKQVVQTYESKQKTRKSRNTRKAK